MRLYQLAGSATTRFAYDGADAIAEYNGSNVLQHRTVFGPGVDEPIVQYDASGNRSWLHADERGSIVATSDASGNMLSIDSYDEYGKPGAGKSGRFQYTGQMWLPETAAYHFPNRDLDPEGGRFLQTDPAGPVDSANLYTYALNNPVNYVDPLGLTPEVPPSSQPPIIVTGTLLGGQSGGAGGAGGGGLGNVLQVLGQDQIVTPPEDQSPIVVTGTRVPKIIPIPVSTDMTPIVVTASALTHQRIITIDWKGFSHIFLWHILFSFEDKSRFAAKFHSVDAIQKLIEDTIEHSIGVPQSNGRIQYTADLGYTVGTGLNGMDTSIMTVIVQPTGPYTGEVVTAFPR
jgi:RHS repeat-associated protein